MGLFSKESCIVCGGKVNALTKAKTAEGSVCSSCLSLCSPNFVSNIKNKNVSEDLDWYQSIDALLTQEGINLNNESTLAIAQRLLNCPLIKSVHDKFAGDEVND